MLIKFKQSAFSHSDSGDEDDSPKGVVLIEEKMDGSKQLMEFLASMNASNLDGKTKIESPHTVANAESQYQLKKDRHDFVVAQAEFYMHRMTFDNSSRFLWTHMRENTDVPDRLL